MSFLLVLHFVFVCAFSASKTITIDNTKPMTDVNGQIINIHEGHIVKWNDSLPYYFYGMQYNLCNDSNITCGPPGVCGWTNDHNITVYSSNDMSSGSWKYENDIFDLNTNGRPYGVYFRMFIFYNKKYRKYVLWTLFNSKGKYISLQSDNPLGPFEIVNIGIEMGHNNGSHGDFYGYRDTSNDNAYIVYNTKGKIAVDLLTDDYTNSTKKTTDFFDINGFQEAPLMFKRNDLFYVLTGHGCCVCLEGSDSNVWISKNGALGPYEFISNIGASGGTSTTQSQMGFMSYIEQSNGDIMYLWSGDRWQQAIDGLHGHDPQIWQPLIFNSNNSIQPLTKIKTFNFTIDV